MLDYISKVLENMPADWLRLTTHRLDIYDEARAKTQFVEEFESLYLQNDSNLSALSELPTAYDYIRLGHPLSCILEWVIAKSNKLKSENVISFSSSTMPILAILRKNKLDSRKTQIFYKGQLPENFDTGLLQTIYGYDFDLQDVEKSEDVHRVEGASIIFVSHEENFNILDLQFTAEIDFWVSIYPKLGSVIAVLDKEDQSYISEIQHVRRRESIAMTPDNCHNALKALASIAPIDLARGDTQSNKETVVDAISRISGTDSNALIASSGLSIQYAIMMGLVDDALVNHKGKDIKFIIPPNCYGGTNDQARRVAACVGNAEVVDLLVDGDDDMVKSLDLILTQVANQDAVPYIIAEIPTNPRVEVPDLVELKKVLGKGRQTVAGAIAISPVFILDQTFCPNVQFLGEGKILAETTAISYASGSKFASGGLCNAGYCVGNEKAESLMKKVELHLKLCDNQATGLQLEILANQLPSMNRRIMEAYENTRDFVNFIRDVLPTAKINFVSEELASAGFTPSVFSLDLPSQGRTNEEREAHKRELNHKLISLMITEIPSESKHCVSYGQMKGCYWTIPATSTQGTTKEGDKDYIARVSLSPELDLDLHKKVFRKFVEAI